VVEECLLVRYKVGLVEVFDNGHLLPEKQTSFRMPGLGRY